MTENSYKTPCGFIHYFVNIIDKQKITLVFLPGLTADHMLFEKQTEYFENKQNVFVWDAPSHALSRPFTNNYSLSDMAEWLDKISKKKKFIIRLLSVSLWEDIWLKCIWNYIRIRQKALSLLILHRSRSLI